MPSSDARPRGHPRGAPDVRAGGRAAKCRIALGERPRRLPAPPDGQLPGRPLPPSARQGVSGAGGRPRRGRRVHEPGAARLDRVHPRPPASGGHGQDAHDHRRAVRRPADLRGRRGLVEGRARHPGRALPPARPSGGRDAARLQGALDAGQSLLRGRVLPLQGHRLRAQARAEAPPAHLGRRRQPRRVPTRGDAGRRLARNVQDSRRAEGSPRPSPRGGRQGGARVRDD